ncbi:YceD family protein [Brevibacillus dissolubilis]|uniref:YceD family protein n=1 Tax=Brevibacillus dissolubilis TaxID=1844116 RepID=UPI001117194E|nr:DUF177 domain-containing protein [Brevibacillus dissolubilis]
MIIKMTDLKNRKGEPLPFRTELDHIDLKKRHQEIRDLTPVQTEGEAVELGGLIYMKGEMNADAKFVCARCLKPFEAHLHVPFSETFAPATADLPEEDEEIHVFQGEEIKLDEVLEEDFLLSVSPFPLCEEDCKGLCPTCGVNRNDDPCSCTNVRIDPRLEGLADLLKKMEE